MQNRSRQTLDGILLAATALFKEAGPPALTFAGIAKAAGVSVGAVQFHFANKEAILEAVITRILDDNLQAEIVLYEQLAGAGGGMSAFLHAYICGQHELLAKFNPHFAKSIEIIKANPSLAAKGQAIGARAEALGKAALGAALERDGLPRVEERIDAAYHAILSFVLRELNFPSAPPGSPALLRRRHALGQMCLAYLTGA